MALPGAPEANARLRNQVLGTLSRVLDVAKGRGGEVTAADLDVLLDRALAFDLEMRHAAPTMRPPASFGAEEHRALNREHELACELMRHGATAEIRTAARLRVLQLEKALTGNTVENLQGSPHRGAGPPEDGMIRDDEPELTLVQTHVLEIFGE